MKIETYRPDQVSTQVASQSTVATPQLADTAGIIGRGLNQLGGAIQTAKNEYDATTAEDALIKFEKEKNDLFFNPDSGYFNKQGRDAYDGAESTNQALIKMQTQYAGGFDSPVARDAFMRASQVHINRASSSIMQHSSAGLRAYENATTAARIENSIESAALNFSNDDELRLQRATGHDSIIAQGRRQGFGDEAINENLQTYDSQFTASSINAALETSDLARANELMGRFGDRMEPREAGVVAKNLHKANFVADSNAEAARIYGAGGHTLSSLNNRLNEMPTDTPDQIAMKEEVTRLATNRYKMEKAARDESTRETYEYYGKSVQDNPDFNTGDISGNVWDSFTVSQRNTLLKIERLKAEGKDIITDEVKFAELRLLPPKELAKINPTDYFDVIGGADRDKLVSEVKAARKPSSGSTASGSGRTRAASVKNTLEDIYGQKTTEFNDAERERANAFYRTVNQAVAQEEVRLGRELGPLEFDSLLLSQKTKATIERSFGPISLYDAEVGQEEVPTEYVDEIVQALVEEGRPVTGAAIAHMYELGKRAKRFE